jgi:hypothetical protein
MNLPIEAKKNLLKALQAGLITRAKLAELNPKEVSVLLANPYALVWIQMGDINSYSFNGKKIDKAEHQRLLDVVDALGLPRLTAKSIWSTGENQNEN